jgi:TonB family protein
MVTKVLSISIAVAILWLAYRVLFINSNRLIFNRVFLIIALGFSLILPSLGVIIGKSAPQIIKYKDSLLHGIILEEIVITPEGVVFNPTYEVGDVEVVSETAVSNKAPINIIGIIGTIWLIGAIGAALIFLFKLGKILFIIIKSPKKKMQGFTAVFTGKEHGPYSFFNYAFFTDENVSQEIVRHEMSHIEHHHSADIIFVELMMILQWFNPFIYLYKRELQSLHEYMADHDVVATGVDKKNYMMLILQQCTAADFSGMSNNFSLILTKKRIKMITQNKKAKGVIVKALLTLPVFALLLFANCKSNGQEKTSSSEQTVKTETPVATGNTITFKLSDGTYLSVPEPFEINVDGQQYYLDLNSIKNDTTLMLGNHEFYAVKNHDERNSLSVKIDGKDFDINFAGGILKDDSKIYTDAVEVAPEYPGGYNAMFEFIQKNLKYPESAKEKGLEGRVFIGFVVEKDGSLSSFQVLRGVCDEIDAEAIKVLKMMPKWKPGMNEGKTVRVQYVLPFNFKLSGNENTMTALSGTHWMGTGIGYKDGSKFVMDMTMDFYNNNDGLFVMKLMAQDQEGKSAPQTVFEDVGLDFTYSYDGKSAGSIQPKNTDGSTLGGEDQQPYSFVMQDGKIIVSFYDFKDDCGIEKITFVKK